MVAKRERLIESLETGKAAVLGRAARLASAPAAEGLAPSGGAAAGAGPGAAATAAATPAPAAASTAVHRALFGVPAVRYAPRSALTGVYRLDGEDHGGHDGAAHAPQEGSAALDFLDLAALGRPRRHRVLPALPRPPAVDDNGLPVGTRRPEALPPLPAVGSGGPARDDAAAALGVSADDAATRSPAGLRRGAALRPMGRTGSHPPSDGAAPGVAAAAPSIAPQSVWSLLSDRGSGARARDTATFPGPGATAPATTAAATAAAAALRTPDVPDLEHALKALEERQLGAHFPRPHLEEAFVREHLGVCQAFEQVHPTESCAYAGDGGFGLTGWSRLPDRRKIQPHPPQALAEGRLVPAESVHLPPNGRARLIVAANVTSDPSMSVKLRKFDATLTIRLREFVRPNQVRLRPRAKTHELWRVVAAAASLRAGDGLRATARHSPSRVRRRRPWTKKCRCGTSRCLPRCGAAPPPFLGSRGDTDRDVAFAPARSGVTLPPSLAGLPVGDGAGAQAHQFWQHAQKRAARKDAGAQEPQRDAAPVPHSQERLRRFQCVRRRPSRKRSRRLDISPPPLARTCPRLGVGWLTAGDFSISDGKMGVIRPYGKREVSFVFGPSMAGPFLERLLVENLLDPHDDQAVVIKAVVIKASTFFVSSLSLAFRPCLVDEAMPPPLPLTITNTSKHTRVLEVAVDRATIHFDVCDIVIGLELEDANVGRTVNKELDERIEALEQKMKIAIRKVRRRTLVR